MAVGRTTVVTDLARAREQLAESGLTIVGRPKVGLSLEGDELGQRLFILRHMFERAYSGEPATSEVVATVGLFADRFHLNAFSREEVLRWARVATDRIANGYQIRELPSGYAELANTPGHAFAHALAVRLAEVTGLNFNLNEEIFLALPIAGMRTPDDAEGLELFTPPDELQTLIEAILTAVSDELDLRVESKDLVTEFAHHLGYMLNRTRYQIWIDDSGVSNIAMEYPVAHQMARIAARVINERLGLKASDPEMAFLAAYFQVFLESHRLHRRSFLQVAIVTGTGRVSARLIEIQLRKVLPISTKYVIVPAADALTDRETLDDSDLVVTTKGVQVRSSVPVVEIDHVFDRRALARQLGPLRFGLPGGASLILEEGTSSLAIALDDKHFFALARRHRLPGRGRVDDPEAGRRWVGRAWFRRSSPGTRATRLDAARPVDRLPPCEPRTGHRGLAGGRRNTSAGILKRRPNDRSDGPASKSRDGRSDAHRHL